MNFADIIWLYLTPALVLILFGLGLLAFRKRDALLERFLAPRLREQLTRSASKLRGGLKLGLLLVAVALIGLALARPQFGTEEVRQPTRGVDVLVVLDVSRSMLATDLSPSRLERAKIAGRDLVDGFSNERVGLVVFAGQAFLLCPMTRDYRAFRESLRSASPDTITRGGTDIGAAIMEAAAAFPSSANERVVVLITDGEDLSERIGEALTIANEKGITIHTVGIGTPEGTTLRIRESGQATERTVLDSAGNPVISRLDESSLRLISGRTGGRYERLTGVSVPSIAAAISAMNPATRDESTVREVPLERFQWPLAVALLLLLAEPLIARRRRIEPAPKASKVSRSAAVLSLFCALGLLFGPSEAAARDSMLSARESFNMGVRLETEGDLAAAREAYRGALRGNDFRAQRDAFHNLGRLNQKEGRSALESGDLEAALNAYENALNYFRATNEIDPNDEASARQLRMTEDLKETIEALIDTLEPPESEDGEEGEPSEDSESGEEGEEGESGEDGEGQEGDGEASSEAGEGDDQQGEDGDETSGDEMTDQEGAEGEENGEEAERESGAGDEADAEDDGETQPVPMPDEAENGEDDATAAEMEAGEEGADEGDTEGQAVIEIDSGMSEADALSLLESMRRNERFLPFTGPATPRESGRSNDW